MDTTFMVAEEVLTIARSLLMFHEHLADSLGSICFLFQDKEILSRGTPKWYSIRPASGADRFLHGFKFLVTIDGSLWGGITAQQREALVDEILASIKVNKLGELSLRSPDVSMYLEVLERRDIYLPSAEEVVALIKSRK